VNVHLAKHNDGTIAITNDTTSSVGAQAPLEAQVRRRAAINLARRHDPVIAASLLASEIAGYDWCASIETALLNLLDAHAATQAAFLKYVKENPYPGVVIVPSNDEAMKHRAPAPAPDSRMTPASSLSRLLGKGD